jgi:hypothetical protein
VWDLPLYGSRRAPSPPRAPESRQAAEPGLRQAFTAATTTHTTTIPVETPLSLDAPVPEQDEPAPEPLGPPPRPPRRRGRTSLIIAVAAVLGVLAGAGAGYQIQYLRPDTPLPSLAQSEPKQPKGTAPSATPLSASQDTLVTYDSDLRKLLLKKPKGATDVTDTYASDGWMDLYDYAETFKDEKYMFSELNRNAFRRLASVMWTTGSYATYQSTEIRLIQFRDESKTFAADHLEDQMDYMPDSDFAGNNGSAIPGSVDGKAWVYSKPKIKAGYLPYYQARVLARQGNIVLDIWVSSSKSISMKSIQSLAKRQLERL